MNEPAAECLVWGVDYHRDFASLLAIENVDDDYRLERGISLADEWPSDASFRMDPAYPRNVALGDALESQSGVGVPIVSPRLRAAIEALGPADVEYLPVAIYDHKGRVASDEYVIVNPFRIVDCIDQEGTALLEWNSIDPEQIADAVGLVLDPARLDPDAPLFRPRYMPTHVFAHPDFAAALDADAFPGLLFQTLASLGE